MDELIAAAERLGLYLLTYLVALTVWILIRSWLDQTKGDHGAEAFEEPAFTKDYFGRAVSVVQGASFGDQHLVLEYSDGGKRYRRATTEEDERAAVASSLRSLVAAAGAHGSIAPESASDHNSDGARETEAAQGQELNVRDLRSH